MLPRRNSYIVYDEQADGLRRMHGECGPDRPQNSVVPDFHAL